MFGRGGRTPFPTTRDDLAPFRRGVHLAVSCGDRFTPLFFLVWSITLSFAHFSASPLSS